MTHLQCDNQLITEICNEYLQDSHFNGTTLPVGATLDPNTGLYWITDKKFVPNITTLKDRLITEFHNTSGHPDANRTYTVILRSFYWLYFKKDVKYFVKLCSKCQRIQPRTDKPYGSSMSLPVPIRPWDSVSMDFITNFPNVDGYDAILTVVCTLSKTAHFIPCNSTVVSRQLAKLFLNDVYRLHGLPRFFIGDRDTGYTSHFF
jgi:hypothetical protein